MNKIDQADYAVWKSNFGKTDAGTAGAGAGAGAEAAGVPEPSSAVLLLTAAFFWKLSWLWKKWKSHARIVDCTAIHNFER